MRALCGLAALVTIGAALAADPAKPNPNTLTPKDISDGWVSLFDGETTFGWRVEGTVEVKDGALVLGNGTKQGGVRTGALFPKNFELLIDVAPGSGKMGEVLFLEGEPGRGLGLRLPPGGVLKVRNQWDGTKATTTIEGADGARQGQTARENQQPGPVAFSLFSGTDTVAIRSIRLRPLNTTPLFNGKDLSGWTVFDGDPKRAKSKFAVTPGGELSVKDGPGDLQTTGQYDDFVLQLECKSNGKWLNSGVFFRCLPGQYQNGYEAQIQNGWTGDRTKPVDAGTGAIYRRVPARRVVSNDNEWFAMTVAASGKHIATWVNGYQTVDWTDDRPADENPRKGSKTGKGHLSIQGHDPTTDLLFRNIRIADLSAKK